MINIVRASKPTDLMATPTKRCPERGTFRVTVYPLLILEQNLRGRPLPFRCVRVPVPCHEPTGANLRHSTDPKRFETDLPGWAGCGSVTPGSSLHSACVQSPRSSVGLRGEEGPA